MEINITKEPSHKDSAIFLTKLNANKATQQHQEIFNSSDYWHRIRVTSTYKQSRENILKAITDAVYPFDFIPVLYQTLRKNRTAFFLVRNCGPALMKLCSRNLIVPTQDPSLAQQGRRYILTISLKYSDTSRIKVDIQDNITAVLTKRFNPTTKVLNLENFYTDPGLREFCVLSQPKILFFVLHCSNSLQYNSLKLNNNEIRVLNSISAIWGSNITSLDLRNNMVGILRDSTKLLLLLLDGSKQTRFKLFGAMYERPADLLRAN